MKKIISFVIASLVLTSSLMAQKVEIQNASNYSRNNDLVRAIECAEKATTHAETSKDSKAWYLKGAILLKLDDMYSIYQTAKIGMTESEYNKALTPYNSYENAALKPDSKKKIKADDGSKYTQSTYLYDVVVKFDDNNKIFEVSEPTNGKFLKDYNNDLLGVALEAFSKAVECKNDEESVEMAKRNFVVIAQRMTNQAINLYEAKNYYAASEAFEKTFLMKKEFFNGAFDTLSYEYANNSIKLQMQDDMTKNDTAAYMKACAMGMKKFPDDVFYVISDANIWLAKNEPEKVIKSLEKAMTMVTDNATIFYAVGVNYAALNNVEKATEAYKKAIALDPVFFDAYYNLAAIYVNTGNDHYTEANNLPISETAKYEKLKKESEEYYTVAIPYLEKAHELDKTDINVLRTLRDIYVRLQKNDDIKRVNDLMKALAE